MHTLFEDDGELKAGTLISETDATAQIETPSGRRLKIKLPAVLLRFTDAQPDALLVQAKAMAPDIDLSLLWETLSDADLSFAVIAKEYFGATATATQQASMLVTLMANPMYFRKRGKGTFKRAPEAELKAALIGLERKKAEADKISAMADALLAGELPSEFGSVPGETIDRLLYANDKMSLPAKALMLASERGKTNPLTLMQRCGALGSAYDYHFRRFLFNVFPKGTAFPEHIAAQLQAPLPLPTASVRAFSIDDAETTEIDDAFSVSASASGETIIGIHIAAPALGIEKGGALDALARDRLSTVYMPGNKITMLPDDVVAAFSLNEGKTVPALSMYATLNPDDSVKSTRTVVENVPIAANLRLQTLDDSLIDPLATQRAPWQDELITLHRFARARFAVRGQNEINRIDYNFYVDADPTVPNDADRARVRIEARARGSAIDLIVSELMIFANSTWAQQLAEKKVAGMFRVQGAGKTRMAVHPGAHEGLGLASYMWASSPLRRYSDLVNQRQIIALAQGETPPYTKSDAALLSAVADFDVTYNQYGDFQQQMENYWCLRWMQQEKIERLDATVIRENLLRFDRLPIVRRIEEMPFAAPGTPVTLRISDIDLIDARFSATPLPTP